MASYSLDNGAGPGRISLLTREYAHITDTNSGVTTVCTGPVKRSLKSNETLALGPTPFHVVPPLHYAELLNPVARDPQTGKPRVGSDGQVLCRLGERELRYSTTSTELYPAFPLYPSEQIVTVAPLKTIKSTEYLVIEVLSSYQVRTVARKAGDRYIFRGPRIYPPRLEERIVRQDQVLVIPSDGRALHCRATESFNCASGSTSAAPDVSASPAPVRGAGDTDREPKDHAPLTEAERMVAGGSEYLRLTPGEYVPSPFEEVVRWVEPTVLKQDQAVQVMVLQDYVDPRPFGRDVHRRAGERFIVSCDDCGSFPLHPYDKVTRHLTRVRVTEREYCTVLVLASAEEAEGSAAPHQRQQDHLQQPSMVTERGARSSHKAPSEGERRGWGRGRGGGGGHRGGSRFPPGRNRRDRSHMSSDQQSRVLGGEQQNSAQPTDVARASPPTAYKTRRVVTNAAFFLQPDEVLEAPPSPIFLLSEGQAVAVKALRDFVDVDGRGGYSTSGNSAISTAASTTGSTAQQRAYGDTWLVRGPCRFIPSGDVWVLADPLTGEQVRERIVLTEGQGIYVRHERTGVIRLIAGPASYMLEAEEVPWEKPLPPHVEQRLVVQPGAHAAAGLGPRFPLADLPAGAAHGHPSNSKADSASLQGKTVHGVGYLIPNRSVTQLFNYRTHTTRTIFGPDRILLEPDEGFTVVSLSGSPWDPARPNTCLPKEPNRITALYLYLGPSNMTDVMQVETSDHARLSLQLCYDWYFDIAYGDAASANRCFVVNDFVGNTCSFIASSVRSAVASLPFEQFHKRSSQVVREAVFGLDPATGKPANELRFPANNLVITTVDIQEMQVLDARTLRGLRKSVEMAIEIATHTQEVQAQQVASAREQEARGLLERQRMSDQVGNEEQRAVLLETERKVLSIVSSSKSTAMAEAVSQAAAIESEAAVSAAAARTQRELLANATLVEVQQRRRAALKDHEASVAKEAADFQEAVEAIRHDLMEKVVSAVGPETIVEMAKAGPELQAALLKSMGLQGYLVTDGSTPINLFRTANGLTGNAAAAGAKAGGKATPTS